MRLAIIRALPLAILAVLYAVQGEWSTAWAWGFGVIMSFAMTYQERLTGKHQYTVAIGHAMSVALAEARKRPATESIAVCQAALEIAKLADVPNPTPAAPPSPGR